MKLRKLIAVSLLLLIVLLSEAASADTIKIGLTLGLTGKYSKTATLQMRGYKLWEKDVNNRGGILGKKVNLIIYDDKSDALTAKSLYKQLILQEKVDHVFGPYSSDITETILPITEKYGYPLLTSATADILWQKGYKHVFGLSLPASKQLSPFLEMLVINGLNDIAIVYSKKPSSEEFAKGAKKWAEWFGLKVALFEQAETDLSSFEKIAAKAMSSNARVLISCGHFEDAVNMRLALKKTGWRPKAHLATVGPAMHSFYNKLKEDAEYVFSSSKWEHEGGFRMPGCRKFYESFVKEYNEAPCYHCAEAYAAGEIFEKAAKKAKTLDKNKIRETLSSLDTTSIIGRYGVDNNGQQIKHSNLIIQWQNGKKRVVWPKNVSTATPVFK